MMGRMIPVDDGSGAGSLESRPGVFLIGSPNVGKRTLLSRLLSIDIPDTSDLSSGVLCQGWTLETKYYSANISIWTAHLDEGFSFRALPISKQLAALVMVFDMSDESSFLALKDWVPNIDIEKFEILLCIGNKADLVPGHTAHTEYRRYLQRGGESTSDPHPEFWDYGIDETEGCSLLGGEEASLEIRQSCLEWCLQYNIEYIEACASNVDFDKCLSVNGDVQGVERLYGALSAHMWPGMIMKSGEKIGVLSPFVKEEMTDEESDYEIEYEVLSRGSDEPWEYTGFSSSELPVAERKEHFADGQDLVRNSQNLKHEMLNGNENGASPSNASASTSSNGLTSEASIAEEAGRRSQTTLNQDYKQEGETVSGQTSTSEVQAREEVGVYAASVNNAPDVDSHYGYEDLERLMCEISGMRDNLRLMPDFQRREMAAKLAMKMATMFGDSSDEDEKGE